MSSMESKTESPTETASTAVQAVPQKKIKCSGSLVSNCDMRYSEGARNCTSCSDVVCMAHAKIIWYHFRRPVDNHPPTMMTICRDCYSTSTKSIKIKLDNRYS